MSVQQEAGTDEKTIRRELGDDTARAIGVEDNRIAIRDVTRIEREQAGNPTVTILRIKREIPDPRDGGRTTSTEHATQCVVTGCEHVEISSPRNIWGESDSTPATITIRYHEPEAADERP